MAEDLDPVACGATAEIASKFDGPPFIVACNQQLGHEGKEHTHETHNCRYTWYEDDGEGNVGNVTDG